MIYPDNLESKLGFDQIRQRLTNYCLSQDFLQIVNSLTSIQACKNFLIKFQEEFPELNKLATPVGSTQDLQREIVSKIDDAAHVKDNATAELQSIRRKLRDEQSRLRRVADQIFRQAVQEKWVPEGALPTVRDGRVVIPILAEHKRKLKGFIQDESATGQTVFMEPAEMLDTNNEIRDLEHAERREVVRILTALTTRLRLELPTLKTAYAFQAVIDFIRAKAKLARDVEAVLPIVENTPVVEWFNAKHPVLFLSLKGKREVVPLTIKLDSTDRVLLVSGPNAGGKSVCLKTLGLLQYMLQCGLLVPMADHSRMGIFKDIFLDIGDQQSLENDLSTYSSHLKNMHVFLENATDQSMVLMDELGSGTDPNFGGAIAQAILASLLTKKVWGLATTHYYNLKLFADQAEGIKNAAMRFDEEHLQPLYQLEMGKPGSSFALEIARKTGMSAATLKVAESLVGTDLAGFEKLSRTLEQERKENEEKTKQVEKLQVELKQTLAKYQTLSSELESKKKDIIGKAKEEAMTLLKTTNREIEKTIRHIRENKAEKKETLKVRKTLQDLSHNVAKGMQEKALPKSERMEEGDRVRIMGQQGSGLILSLQGKNAVVQFGELKSTVSLTKLEKVEGAFQKELAVKLRSSGINLYEKQAAFNPSLDVRGKRVEELMPVLESFMDSAILLSHGELRILHGKGEGVLRKVIRDRLKQYKQVASFKDEHVDRGGDGITIVVLK
ncbi:MAG: endonuclease MutS2 [Cytophagia bacterium]|nr:endonuclease MutS2 [Cytophagia bacterium]